MTKDTLTHGSTDLSEHVQSITVDYRQLDWHHAPDPTVRPEHRDLALRPFVFDCITTPLSPSFVQSVGRLDRCSMISIDDLIKSKSNPNIARLIRKALRTYPKRMSRAKRKEARARERRRVERHNQWWSNR